MLRWAIELVDSMVCSIENLQETMSMINWEVTGVSMIFSADCGVHRLSYVISPQQKLGINRDLKLDKLGSIYIDLYHVKCNCQSTTSAAHPSGPQTILG